MKVADFTFDTAPLSSAISSEQALPTEGLESLESLLGRAGKDSAGQMAMSDNMGCMDHAALHSATGAVARFITAQGFAPETPVAVLCGRNRFYGVAALGILRAGAVYTPLDPALPLQRLALILRESTAPLLITDSTQVDAAQRLQVMAPGLQRLLCLDTPTFEEALEKPGDVMALDLWDAVTAKQADGSWKSYFDGTPLPPEALQGMADNMLDKVGHVLTPLCRVLDIGSGGGVVARTLVKRCAHYTAVDLSRHDLERLTGLRGPGTATIKTHHMEALDIGMLPADAPHCHDLICLNSVIESFPGYNYLRAVLTFAVERLKEGGHLFVGMVWDVDKKEQYRNDILNNASEHALGSWFTTAFDAGRELFVPRAFFEDWAAHVPLSAGSVRVEFSPTRNPLHELAAYRYDVVIHKLPQPAATPAVKAPASKTRFGTADMDFSPFTALPIPHNHAAYIIFTSGTTGVPKGVVVEHGSLLRMAREIIRLVQNHVLPRHADMVGRPWRCLLLSSCAFDASLQLLLAAPLYGHSLYWADEEVRKNPPALHKLMTSKGIDLSDGTPSLFSLLLAHWEESGQSSSARAFILGGEALRRELLERFYRLPAHAGTCVANAYGPTECCVNVTLYPLDISNHNDHAEPPLGLPVAGAEWRLSDTQGLPLPHGLPGELWISGPGLARGYWKDEKKTRTAFVQVDGKRWYRTGDICRYAHGLLFYIGRMDQQVKVAGNRVELGDVESALCAAPGVRQAAVRAEDFAGDGVLALGAWIVPQKNVAEKDVADFLKSLRAWLENHLPAYARPVYYCLLDDLPLNASGKADHNSLPRMPRPGMDDSKATPPRTETQRRLLHLWGDVLGRPVRDIRSDFFALGGHSVLAIRLLSRMEKAFGYRLPLAELFRHPTLEALAAAVDNHTARESYCPVIPLAATPGKMPLFLFHPVGGSVYCYKELATHLAPFASVYAVEPPGFSMSTPHMFSVEDMAQMYMEEIRRHVDSTELEHSEGVLFAGWSFGGLLAYETARRFRAGGGRVKNIVLLDCEVQRGTPLPGDENDMLEGLFEGLVPLDKDKLRNLKKDDRLDYLVELGLAHNRLPSGFTREHMHRLLLTFHYNTLAGARYTPLPSDERGLLIRGQQISTSSGITGRSPALGWEPVIQGGLTLRWIDATHESMLMDGHVQTVASYILEEINTPAPSVPARPSCVRLFTLPYGGGSAQAYRPLRDFLNPHIELHPVELPGRYARAHEPLLRSLSAMADDVFAQLHTRLDQSYALFGHSMGAALAWLCCQRFHAAGLPLPWAVFLSSPPLTTFLSPECAHIDPDSPVHALPSEAFFRRVGLLGGLPQEVMEHAGLLDYIEPILRADLQAVETWRPTAPSRIPVVTELFFGTDEHDAPLVHLTQQHASDCSGQTVPVHLFAGGHFYLYNHWEALALRMNIRLLTPSLSDC